MKDKLIDLFDADLALVGNEDFTPEQVQQARKEVILN